MRCTCCGVELAHLGGDAVRCSCCGFELSNRGGDVFRAGTEACADDLRMGCDIGPQHPPDAPLLWLETPGSPGLGAPNGSGEMLRVGFCLEGIEFVGKEDSDAECDRGGATCDRVGKEENDDECEPGRSLETGRFTVSE